MARVDFYHLTRDPPATVLATLAAKAISGGGRMLVVSGDAAQREAIGHALWEAPGFVANGIASGTPDDTRQPVLIAADAAEPANGARLVALADGVWREAALRFDRALLLFEEATIADARKCWRGLDGLADDGGTRHYWKQDEQGRWREGP